MFWIYLLIGIICFLLVMLTIIGTIGFRMSCMPRKKKPETDPKRIERIGIRKKNNEFLLSHKHEDVETISDNGLKLKAYYVPAPSETKRFVICIHGYNCNGPDECSHLFPFYHYEMGYNYLLPDLRAHGRSEGRFIGFGALDSRDIKLWIKYLTERFGEDIEIMLHGISMGAATAMLVNNTNPPKQVRLIVEDCGFTSAFEEVEITTKDMLGGIRVTELVGLFNIFCRLIAKYDLKKDASPLLTMKNAKNPVLFIHGEDDVFVPFEMCGRLYNACPAKKDIMTVPDTDHAYSYYNAKDAYDAKVKAFIEENWSDTVRK